MTPKFSVGEVVILQSETMPECNGEYSVTEIWPPDGERINSLGEIASTFGYSLSCDDKESASCWAESALRKKHHPGEHSFTELMASLKNPVNV